jgi:aspartate-semialdehyde dehydrogenase
MRKYNIAVVGATGAVGEELFEVLKQRDFPVANLLPLASKSSAGKLIEFNEIQYKIEELTEDVFVDRDIDAKKVDRKKKDTIKDQKEEKKLATA